MSRGELQNYARCDLEYSEDDPGIEARSLATRDAGVQRIILFHGPCEGTCPIYSVSVWASGRVDYAGGGFVGRTGCFTRQIPEPVAHALFAAVFDAGIAKMPRSFAAEASDLPSTIVGLTFPSGPGWCVDHYGEADDTRFNAAPPAFHDITAQIEAVAGSRGLSDGWDGAPPLP